ncbi:hypothetical protein MRB53_027111 [Persea americana]|uniref:Uncharacterized protein n=1 Tax=Persea americana TaxID=3435 RepID=A0ACC2LK80_PERAE|nr:hypothetical protein MRB53_027111 [Persea americana]
MEGERDEERREIGSGWGASGFRASRRRRMARRRRWSVDIAPTSARSRSVEDDRSSVVRETEENGLRFLMQKELRNSDVGSLGRIVLPKKGAEAHLPVLTVKEGILISMEDMETFQVWNFKYRFWPNNKSRMYVLENTGEFVKAHNLRLGDFVMFYRDDHRQKYFIRAKKNLDHHRAPSSSTLNGFYNGKTIDDQLVPEIEVSKASFFHANQPVADEMSTSFFMNDPFAAEFPIYFASEMMGNAPRLEPIPSFGSFENLSLDDFE